MKWLAVHIDASPSGLEPVEAALSALGLDGLVIEDEADFRRFLEQNKQYWDYVDEELDRSMTGKCRITFYAEENEEGFGKAAAARIAIAELKKNHPDSRVDVYLGFSGQPMLVEEYERVADSVTVNVGGFVTDDIDPAGYDVIMTCGPEVMMRVLYQKCVDTGAGAKVYVSMENRMACGMGACLVCTCKTKSGNKRACKDGPVMEGWEVFG